MTTFKAHFGGYVKDMDATHASIEIDRVSSACGVSKGDLVKAARASFMQQMPMQEPEVCLQFHYNMV